MLLPLGVSGAVVDDVFQNLTAHNKNLTVVLNLMHGMLFEYANKFFLSHTVYYKIFRLFYLSVVSFLFSAFACPRP